MKISNLLVPAMFMVAFSFTSCSDNDDTVDELSSKEKQLQVANTHFVDNTVIPTYKALPDQSLLPLYALETPPYYHVHGNVSSACDLLIKSSQYLE